MSLPEEIDCYDNKIGSLDNELPQVLPVEQQQKVSQKEWNKVRRRIGMHLPLPHDFFS